MSTIQPKGEKVRKAVRWIAEMKQEDETRTFVALIRKASLEFNLSPREEAFLMEFYKAP
jgi:hypothetical protein